jgi:hypothetical protein
LHGWGEWICSKLSKLRFVGLIMGEISDETHEQLRQIFDARNGKSYSLEEAEEIGDGLLDFFTPLIELDKEDVGAPDIDS